MLVDVHGFIGTLGERQSSPAALHDYLQACGVEKLLIGNLDAAGTAAGGQDAHEPDANLECLRVARQDSRLAPLYWLRPGRPDSNVLALAGALDTEPFAGVLLAPALNDFALDDERLERYLQVATRLNRAVFVLIGPDNRTKPERVYALAKRHARTTFVMLNSAAGAHSKEALDVVVRSRQRSDAKMLLDTAHRKADEIRAAVSTAGAEVLLFGSDAPEGEPHAIQVRRLLDELRESLSPWAFLRLTAQNALELLSPAAK